MKSLRTLRPALFAAPLLVVPLLAAGPAYSQTAGAQPAGAQTAGSAASLMEALTLVSGGLLLAPGAEPVLTPDGDRFRVHIPIPKLTAPPNAAIDATAAPVGSAWDITGLTFPPTGTIVTQAAADKPPATLRFTIGQQTSHARIDPTLAVPSPYAMAFSDIAVHIDSPETPGNLTIAQMTLDGTLTGDGGGHMTTRSHGKADNWRFSMADKDGTPVKMSLRSLNVVYDVDGLDRAKAESLREKTRAITATQQANSAAAGQLPVVTPAFREQLRTLIDASSGLLSSMKVEETFQGLHFDAAGDNNGDIGEIRFAMASEAANDKVAAHVDIGVNDVALTAVPAQFVQYVPRRVSIRTAFSGIPAEKLRELLREATMDGADPDDLQAKAIGLLNAPGAHAGIETLHVESGPLLLEGTARVRALPDGTAGYEMHLTAHGLDAMLALVQADPKAAQITPMLYMAKGMAKPEGDGVVWNIAFADGVLKVNGTPMGQQPGGGEPGVRPPGRPPVRR
jgi:hypothetical protein